MPYERDPKDNSIFSKIEFPSKDIVEFRAVDLEATPTGKTYIEAWHTPPEGERGILYSHSYSVRDGKTREWFANKVHASFKNGFSNAWTKTDIQEWLFDFTSGLKAYDSHEISAETVKGTPGWRVEFLAFPHIIDGGLSIMSALGGATKSYIALALAISIDAGVDKIWPIEVSGPVLYINMERSKRSIAGRIGWVNEALGLDGDRDILVFHTQGKRLHQIAPTLRRLVAEKGIVFAVLDSISRSGIGDLNKNQEANESMDLMIELFPSSLVLAHSPKQSPGSTYGAVMFDNAADVKIGLQALRTKGDNTTWTKYTIDKGNDVGLIGEETVLAFEFETDPHPDSRIKISRLVNIRIPDAEEIPNFDEPARNMSPTAQIIFDYLMENGATTPSIISAVTGLNENTVNSTLRRLKDETFWAIGNGTWKALP